MAYSYELNEYKNGAWVKSTVHVSDEEDAYYGAKVELLRSLKEKFGIKNSVWSCDDATTASDFNKPFPLTIHQDKPLNFFTYDVSGAEHGIALKEKNGWTSYHFSVLIPKGATYKQVWHLLDELIGKSGDKSHIFIEKFYLEENGEINVFLGS